MLHFSDRHCLWQSLCDKFSILNYTLIIWKLFKIRPINVMHKAAWIKYTKNYHLNLYISHNWLTITHTQHMKSRLPRNYFLYMYIIFLYQKAMPLKKAQITISEAQDMTVFCTQFALIHEWHTNRRGDVFDDMHNMMHTKSREWSQSTGELVFQSAQLGVSFPITSKSTYHFAHNGEIHHTWTPNITASTQMKYEPGVCRIKLRYG
jgi:hypothetical protein